MHKDVQTYLIDGHNHTEHTYAKTADDAAEDHGVESPAECLDRSADTEDKGTCAEGDPPAVVVCDGRGEKGGDCYERGKGAGRPAWSCKGRDALKAPISNTATILSISMYDVGRLYTHFPTSVDDGWLTVVRHLPLIYQWVKTNRRTCN